MTLDQLKQTLNDDAPPDDIPQTVAALWWEANGDWDKAHQVAQGVDSPDGAWVHAYLHRKEPDPGNAAYWYRRAGKPVCDASFDEEWNAIASALLK